MCIIVYHPSGAELPNKDVLKRCWRRNDDGGGLVVVREGGLRLWKGFMNWGEFWASYRNEVLTERDEFALHFRWATSGGVDKSRCHPFPITESVWEMCRLKFRPREGVKEAIMHNGVLGRGKEGLSDTMVFIRDELVDMKDSLGDVKVVKGLEEATKGSKLLIFWRGKVVRTGSWEEDKSTGIFYSNDGYKEKTYVYYSPSSYNSWGDESGGWESWKNEFFRGEKKKAGEGTKKWNTFYICPQCGEKGWDKSRFSPSCFWDRITCLNCGCLFTSEGDILGYSETLWGGYEERYKKEFAEQCGDEGDIVCENCGRKATVEDDNIIVYDETVDMYYCMICDCYLKEG